MEIELGFFSDKMGVLHIACCAQKTLATWLFFFLSQSQKDRGKGDFLLETWILGRFERISPYYLFFVITNSRKCLVLVGQVINIRPFRSLLTSFCSSILLPFFTFNTYLLLSF